MESPGQTSGALHFELISAVTLLPLLHPKSSAFSPPLTNFSVLPLKLFLQENFVRDMRQAEERFAIEDDGAFEMIKDTLLGPE